MRLALGDHRPDPGLGVEGGNAGAARANAFGERALRTELELELSRKIEFGEKLVLADVGRDHLTDLAVVEKRPETEAIGAAIVRDDREILDAACEQAGDQMLRSEEHTSELQSLMRISYAVFCLNKKNPNTNIYTTPQQ